jgi:hypothetical protein
VAAIHDPDMTPGPSPQKTAAEIERRVTALRLMALQPSSLAATGDEDTVRAHLAAIAHVAEYAALLRRSAEPTGRRLASGIAQYGRYLLKLELPDGRWDLVEAQLDLPPSLGSVIDVTSLGTWEVRRSELVKSKPSRKSAREFFVCAPAA